ncbi:MAG TPA: hypothetical protein VK524_18075 [Polyangiaceae bacterium]|nr:hypothetical protein [Polyangiaceae bacterium]
MSLEQRARVAILAAIFSLPAHAQTPAAPRSAAPAPASTGAASAPAAGGAAPAPGERAPAAGAAPAGESSSKAPAGPVGGYSWTEKPARRKAALKRKRRAPAHGPLATYPGFRVLPNGTSELVLRVSKKVNVQMQRADGRVAFVLPSVQVGVRNNTNPLITTHFDTPLARARLVEHEQGAELVLELREAVVPKFSISEGPGGAISLLITLPAPARTYSEQRAVTSASGALLRGRAAASSSPRAGGR